MKRTVPAFISCNYSEILSLCFCTFPHATRHTTLEFMGAAHAAIASLQLDSQTNGVTDTVTAPYQTNCSGKVGMDHMLKRHIQVLPTQDLTVRKLLPYAWPLSNPALFNSSHIAGKSSFMAPNISMRWPPVIYGESIN